MSFKEYTELNLDQLAQRYFSELLQNTDLTLAQLRDELNAESVQKYMYVTLGDIYNHQIKSPKGPVKKSTVLDDALVYLRRFAETNPKEYVSAEDIAEAVGSSTQYVSRLLKDFGGDLPLSVGQRQQHRAGRPQITFRYVPEWD